MDMYGFEYMAVVWSEVIAESVQEYVSQGVRDTSSCMKKVMWWNNDNIDFMQKKSHFSGTMFLEMLDSGPQCQYNFQME